jgi:hypothetical protein
MLGMWHTHADGVVRQVAEHPEEFALVGFYDPEAQVVTERRKHRIAGPGAAILRPQRVCRLRYRQENAGLQRGTRS